jgi:hypothetical protein
MESVAVDGLREGKIYSGFAQLARRGRLKEWLGTHDRMELRSFSRNLNSPLPTGFKVE